MFDLASRGALIAGAVSLALAALLYRLTRTRRQTPEPRSVDGPLGAAALMTLAVAAGFMTAWAVRDERAPPLPPSTMVDWAFWIGALAWLHVAFRGASRGWRGLIGIALAFGYITDATLGALVPHRLAQDARIGVTAAVLLSWLAMGLPLDRRAPAIPGRLAGELAVLVAAGFALVMGSSLNLGLASMSLAAAALGTAAGVRILGEPFPALPRAATGWILGHLLISGAGYADVPVSATILLAVGWLVTDVPWHPRTGRLPRRSASWLLCAACIAGALVLVWTARPAWNPYAG